MHVCATAIGAMLKLKFNTRKQTVPLSANKLSPLLPQQMQSMNSNEKYTGYKNPLISIIYQNS